MSTNHRTPNVAPGHECASFAALLPVLDEAATDPRQAARLREHLTTCAYCRAEYAHFQQMDGALRRHFGPEVTPRLETADIVWVLSEEEELLEIERPQAYPGKNMPRIGTPVHGSRPRRIASGLAGLAAVLVIAVMAEMLFSSRGSTTQKPSQTSGPYHLLSQPVKPGTQVLLTSVSMDSATDGWAIGEVSSTLSLWHYSRGSWKQAPASFPVRQGRVVMLSPTDGWAVGVGGSSGPMLHYDGKVWVPVAGVSGDLTDIQMLSATEGWAVGSSHAAGDQPLILHYTGDRWISVAAPSAASGVDLNAVSMVSAAEGWAVGTSWPLCAGSNLRDPCQPAHLPSGYLLHYVGGSWVVQATLPHTSLMVLSVAPGGEGWVSGLNFTLSQMGRTSVTSTEPELFHYADGTLRHAGMPGTGAEMPGLVVHRIYARSTEDVWAVGEETFDSSPDHSGKGVVLHYTGGQWVVTRISPPTGVNSLQITDIAPGADGEAWAVGSAWWPRDKGIPGFGTSYTPTITPLILHLATGIWGVYAD